MFGTSNHSVSSSKSYLAKCILSCTMSITGEGKLKGLEPNDEVRLFIIIHVFPSGHTRSNKQVCSLSYYYSTLSPQRIWWNSAATLRGISKVVVVGTSERGVGEANLANVHGPSGGCTAGKKVNERKSSEILLF